MKNLLFNTKRYSKSLIAFAVFFQSSLLLGWAQVETSNEIVEGNITTEDASVSITKVVTGLEHPWAVAWLPDGKMLVTERPGGLYLIDGDKVIKLEGIPKINPAEDDISPTQGGNQGGLLDVVVHPDYASNGWIYLTYSSPGDDDSVTSGEDEYGTGTALARAKIDIDNGTLTDLETIYAQVPRTNPGRHYGSRIVFPGDGTVLFSIGDRGLRWNSQDLTDPAGSIIRLADDGSIVEDNPFVGVAPGNLRPEIFSYGHRNNQGLAINKETGEIWSTEHGPNGGDLLHRIEKGKNYGWPQITFGEEYSTNEKSGLAKNKAPGITQPVHIWEENMAPSGLAFYHNGGIGSWNGNLFAGSLLLEQVQRLVLENNKVVHEEILFTDKIGRIRDVRQGPDGFLYLVTDEEDGGVYRVSPAE